MHSIRLRHPWDFEQRDGRNSWKRKFNWPAGNAAGESVFLVVEPHPAQAAIVLNDKALEGQEETGRFAVTNLLAEFNRLEIILPAEEFKDSKFPLHVQLEITAAE